MKKYISCIKIINKENRESDLIIEYTNTEEIIDRTNVDFVIINGETIYCGEIPSFYDIEYGHDLILLSIELGEQKCRIPGMDNYINSKKPVNILNIPVQTTNAKFVCKETGEETSWKEWMSSVVLM